jgi:hypothetical protein
VDDFRTLPLSPEALELIVSARNPMDAPFAPIAALREQPYPNIAAEGK